MGENELWACVAIYEFGDGTVERKPLFVATRERCERFDARLGRLSGEGRGLIYEGTRLPVHALTVVCRASEME